VLVNGVQPFATSLTAAGIRNAMQDHSVLPVTYSRGGIPAFTTAKLALGKVRLLK